MERRGLTSGCLKLAGVLVLMALAAAAALWGLGRYVDKSVFNPDPVTIANASLQGMRAQNRLSVFSASYVAVVTSKQDRFGLSAQKTMILPGAFRYDVDLAKLNQDDVRWDAQAKKLSVRLPPVEVTGPQIDLDHIRQYKEGGMLMRLTDAEARLDQSNRTAAQAELLRQARGPTPMRLAREAARQAVQRSFAMPLKAAGLDATVDAYFADERTGAQEEWDRSKSLQEIFANQD